MKHKNIEIQPCRNDWYAMEVQQDGNRFCQNCSKVVHDLSDFSAEELKSFLKANPGSCGKFLEGQVQVANTQAPYESASKRVVKNASWKKVAATAAAFALLQGHLPANNTVSPLKGNCSISAEANPSDKKSGPSTNTLLTGVVLEQNGDLVTEPIVLKLYRGNALLAEPLLLDHGLFSIDLQGQAVSSDRITIVIQKQEVNGTKFARTASQTLLGEGQNLQVLAEVTYRPIHMLGYINVI